MTVPPPPPPPPDERAFWNRYDTEWYESRYAAQGPDPVAARRGDTVLRWLAGLHLHNPRIIEVGCASGWLSDPLSRMGTLTATDIADEVVQRAKARYPHIDFQGGDFLTMPLASGGFDVAVAVDLLSCISDPEGAVRRFAEVVKPGGWLLAVTPNRVVFERREDLDPRGLVPYRRWLTRGELRRLLAPAFTIRRITSVVPVGHRGILRLVNSYKLDAVLRPLLGNRLDALKEWLGYGQSWVVLAQNRK